MRARWFVVSMLLSACVLDPPRTSMDDSGGAAGTHPGSSGAGGSSSGASGATAAAGAGAAALGGEAGADATAGADTRGGTGGDADTGAGEGGAGQAGGAESGRAGEGGDSASDGGASAGEGGSGAGSGAGPVFHVFLLLGQSNMAGWPKAEPADRTEDPRVLVLGYDDCAATGRQPNQWDTAAPPLHECWNGAIGPGDHFAKTLLPALAGGDTIGLVPCAVSGERIETFMKSGGTRYAWIVERAKLAQEAGGVIQGMLFHQGESNCGDGNWPSKVVTLAQDLRADLDLGDAPFLAGELPYAGGCAHHNTQVNRIPGLLENSYVVSASGLAVDPLDTTWNLHFDHAAQVELGQRYAAKMVEALGW